MRYVVGIILMAVTLTGCIVTGPAVSKSSMGNVEINVEAPEGLPVYHTELYVDGVFIGNVSKHMPVLHLRRGERAIGAELRGCKTFEKKLLVLGDPNHQVLNIVLEKK